MTYKTWQGVYHSIFLPLGILLATATTHTTHDHHQQNTKRQKYKSALLARREDLLRPGLFATHLAYSPLRFAKAQLPE